MENKIIYNFEYKGFSIHTFRKVKSIENTISFNGEIVTILTTHNKIGNIAAVKNVIDTHILGD